MRSKAVLLPARGVLGVVGQALRLPGSWFDKRSACPTILWIAARALGTFAIASTLSAELFGGVVETVAPKLGQPVASIAWTDETGRVRQLSEFAGNPVILLPVYTRCRGTCIANVDQLERALANSSADPKEFRVLLFSFDGTDTPAMLTSYRARERIPLGWNVGTASQPNIDALMESIGFQYGKAGTEFMHPNVLVVLDSNLRVAKWIYGSSYSTGDIDTALKVAAGQSDWIGRHSDLLYALLLFAASILCVALSYYLLQLNVVRRARRAAGPSAAVQP
jgi:cytochrome oxidase Cu insertion factor (SCO1/SenC/PrrC family)